LELSEKDIGRSIRTKLLYEGPYLTYGIKYEADDNLLQDLYPIHPIELHCGYVIGKNKTVTCVSGDYGFGDDSGLTVRSHDPSGFRLPDRTASVRTSEQGALAGVQLKPGEMAIISRAQRRGRPVSLLPLITAQP